VAPRHPAGRTVTVSAGPRWIAGSPRPERLGVVAAAVLLAAAVTVGATAAAVMVGATGPPRAGAAAAGGSSAAERAAGPAPPPPIAWSPCPTEPGYRCGTVPVPVDYARPHGPVIELSVIEKPAADPSADHGVLLFNPGGPGESGVQILPILAALVPPGVADDFDLVSFDERGTGASDDLLCGPSPAAVASLDPLPPSAGGGLPAASLFRRLSSSCQRRYPTLVPEVDSTDAARDMDRIRQALGVQTISYWGLSYGTVLGSVYAHLFPHHVRAMVLDGAVDATQPLTAQAAAEAPAIAASLDHFLSTCGGHEPCPLGPDPAATYRRIAAQLQREPIPAHSGGPVTVGDLYTATLYALSVPRFASSFPTALAAAAEGQGGPLLELALEFEQDLDGRSLVGAQWTYTCNDATGEPDPATAARLARTLDARDGPAGAEAVTYDLGGCLHWPAPSRPLTTLAVNAGPRILVIGNTGDPNTPHASAVHLVGTLGRATLLTWHGWGHTWLLNGSDDPCMDRAVVDYLVHGTSPGHDASCP
jgi:pimeloyl-ACP methyl ester carboxylesterase